jgi:hypothetical protein
VVLGDCFAVFERLVKDEIHFPFFFFFFAFKIQRVQRVFALRCGAFLFLDR